MAALPTYRLTLTRASEEVAELTNAPISGDIGSVDHEGFLYIRDRAKDIIIRGGENISATGVENAIFKNPKVQDCAVVGVTDKRLGELPAAVVVIRPNAGKVTEQDIIDDCKKHIPKHEIPVMVMLREPKDASDDSGLRIERNANGKIVKSERHCHGVWFFLIFGTLADNLHFLPP